MMMTTGEYISSIGIAVAIASLITTIIFSLFQRKWANDARRRDEYIDLKKRMENLLLVTIQYPYLEDESITTTWSDNKGSMNVRHMRYNQFCCILYNFLSDLHKHFKGDRKQIEDFVDIKNWVRIHRDIWEHPLDPYEISDGYSKEFRDFINSYLK